MLDKKQTLENKINGVMLTKKMNETTINDFSNKLIFIDGKEASEKDLKKLPASDIRGINTRVGNEVREKYGDKAKNGVVFITTKKAK